MRGNVNNNFHRVTNQSALKISNNSKDEGHQTASNKAPHYEKVPTWKGRSAMGNSKMDSNSIKNPKLPLIKKGLLPLNSSFVMNKNGENIPPVPTNDSAALAAMLSVPPPSVTDGMNDSEMQIASLKAATGDKKSEMAVKADAQTAWSLLHEYWTFVQENPYDFNGWSYLLSHVESMKHIEAARSAFEGFLPLYPYCFAYWKKLADLELKYSTFQRCLGVLIYGTKSVPLCQDIWISLFHNFKMYEKQENLSVDMTRLLYKIGLERIGLSWHSSPFWEECIKFEIEQGDYLKVMTIYKWLISIPIKVYNKHWDQLVAIIRDNHPQRILSLDVFDHYYRVCCGQLKIKYVTPQQFDPKKPPKIDDQIVMLIKEKILAGLIKIHEENIKEVEKRWKFEEKIKRPYFHVKPIEKRQLKAWKDYLEFEVKQGDPVRTLILFERCLVACAQYEEMWCRYATFLESHVQCVVDGKYTDIVYRPGCFSNENNDSENTKSGKNSTNEVDLADNTQKGVWFDFYYDIGDDIKTEGSMYLEQLCDGVEVGSRVLTCPSLTPPWILQQVTWEDVRQVYRRASWIHCPSKPLILMQWADFEETQGDVQTARDLLNTVLSKHPKCLKARIQLIDLERREGMLDRVEELYGQAFSTFNIPKQKSYIAIRYARFLFKFKDDCDNALALIRKALKKDKGNIYLYNQVFNICYEKRPVDCDGVLAAVMLALASKDLSLEQKRQFCLQRAQFLREHGTITQIKDAHLELFEIDSKLDAIKEEKDKIENEKRKQEEDKQNEIERIEREKKEKEAKKAEELKRENALEQGELERANEGESQYGQSRRYSEGASQKPDHDSRRKKHRRKRSQSPRNTRRLHDKRRKRSRNEERNQNNRKSRGSVETQENTRTGQNEFLPPPPQPDGILTTNDFCTNKLQNVGTLVMPPENMNQLPPMMVPPPIAGAPFIKTEVMRFIGGQSKIGMRPPHPMFNDGGMQRALHQLSESKVNSNVGLLGEYSGNSKVGNRVIPPLLSLNTAPPNQERAESPNNGGIGFQDSRQIKPTQNQEQPRSLNPLQNQGPPILNNPGQIQGQLRPMNPLQNQGQLRQMNPMQNQGQLRQMNPLQNQRQLRQMNPIQNQGQLSQMNPLQNQGQLSQMNPLQNQGQLRQMNPLQNQGQMNTKQPQGQLRQMNPMQGQSQPRQMNPVQNQGQQRPMNPIHSQGQIRPLNPLQIQGPLDLLLKSIQNQRQNNSDQDKGPLSRLLGPVQTQGQVRPLNPSQDQPTPLMSIQNEGLIRPMNPVQSQAPVRPFSPPSMNNRPPFQPMSTPVPRNIAPGTPVINVPDWLISEGGELKLSQGPKGDCVLKYWPRFMNEMGHETLLTALRKSIKWLDQKVVLQNGSWVDLQMMLSWLGPCDYKKDGVSLNANPNWPSEIVDLLHTLSRVCETETEFNSCLLRLYRNGYDHQTWDSEEHPAMNNNPKIAVVSVGATRTVEMRHKHGSEYMRFPLLPGSLLFMEGATQADWVHQISKDPKVAGERISLSFRTMLMINGITV